LTGWEKKSKNPGGLKSHKSSRWLLDSFDGRFLLEANHWAPFNQFEINGCRPKNCFLCRPIKLFHLENLIAVQTHFSLRDSRKKAAISIFSISSHFPKLNWLMMELHCQLKLDTKQAPQFLTSSDTVSLHMYVCTYACMCLLRCLRVIKKLQLHMYICTCG
jgi:hypothetical protein